MAYQIPQFLMGQTVGADFSPFTNALGKYQDAQKFNAQNALARDQLAEMQRQHGIANALARDQFGIQRETADRAASEHERLGTVRQDVRQYLTPGDFPGIPEPLVGLARVTEDAKPVEQYIISEAKRKAEGSYGKQGTAYYDPATGRSYTIQFGANGERKILPVEAQGGVALNPDKGVKTVDTATGTRVIDAARGRDVREIPKEIAERESQEKQGAARGQAIADLPRKQLDAQRTLSVVDKLLGDGRGVEGLGGNFGMVGMVPNMPGGKAADANTLIEQVRSRAFLEGFNSVRGGGAITEAEGQKATTALIRAQNAQSLPAFLEALAEFKYQVQTGLELARRQAGIGGPNGNTGMDAGGRSFQLPPGYAIEKVK